jgi:hypothetical protein
MTNKRLRTPFCTTIKQKCALDHRQASNPQEHEDTNSLPAKIQSCEKKILCSKTHLTQKFPVNIQSSTNNNKPQTSKHKAYNKNKLEQKQDNYKLQDIRRHGVALYQSKLKRHAEITTNIGKTPSGRLLLPVFRSEND